MESHNLDISQYNFNELLELFELDPTTVSIHELTKAKRKVLFMHPDKSGLPPEYFLFYKKAYDMVYQMYGDVHRINTKLPEEAPEYIPNDRNIQTFSIEKKNFQEKFNKLFEENKIQRNIRSNDWFSNSSSTDYKIQGNVNDSIERLKDTQQNLVKYNGVQMLMSRKGSSFYDDDEDEQEYVESDLFSKLKFEDLRKVHKDQTIFNGVRQQEFHGKDMTVEEYQRQRNHLPLPISKQESEKIIENRNAMEKQKMIQKQHQAQLQSFEIEERNKKVMAHFLHLR
jgi:hypothetical protein